MNYSFLELKKEKNDKKCREGFHRNAGPEFVYPDDPFPKLYYSALGIYAVYLLIKMITKKK